MQLITEDARILAGTEPREHDEPAEHNAEPDVDESDEGPGYLALLDEDDLANAIPPAH